MLPAQPAALVRDIRTNLHTNPPSLPNGFVGLNGIVCFSARTAATGLELFRSGGTPATGL